MVFMMYFKHPNICWRDNIAGHERSRRFLESHNDNFLTPMMSRGALLDLIFTNREGLGVVKFKASFGYSNHEMGTPERKEEGKKQDHNP